MPDDLKVSELTIRVVLDGTERFPAIISGGNVAIEISDLREYIRDQLVAAGLLVPLGGMPGDVVRRSGVDPTDLEWSSVGLLPISSNAGYVLTQIDGTAGNVAFEALPNDLPFGGTTRQVLAKASDTDHDSEWTTILEVPTGGADGDVLQRVGVSAYAWGAPYNPIPLGGTLRQALVKASSDPRHLTYVTIREVPEGGSSGDVLQRSGAADVVWGAPVNPLPTGGTTRQALVKVDGTNYNVQYVTLRELPTASSPTDDGKTLRWTGSGAAWELVPNPLPTGGTTRQALVKVDGTNYNVAFVTLREVPDPTAATNGQVVTRVAGVPAWASLPNDLPVGGTAGQALVKVNSTNYNATWSDVQPVLPTTTSTGHVLTQIDPTPGNVGWAAVPGTLVAYNRIRSHTTRLA